jgi:hypothetical protein
LMCLWKCICASRCICIWLARLMPVYTYI